MLSDGLVLNDRYRIERILGQGGMGAVYLATHLQLDEKVALKEMLFRSADPELRGAWEQQFRAESRILNRLRHPFLPRVYDFFEINDHHYLVMDYIQGGTLEAAQDKGPVAEKQALQWALQLCEVLNYLHTHDPPVVFRDLKPANIMLATDGTIRLIDFGIAKVFEEAEEGGVSTRTVLRGAASHGYSAPEQYGIGGTDARSDIYSLGATLYALLTSHVPPPAMELAAGMGDMVPLREYRADLSDTTVSAVEWMMQVRREMRPPSVVAVQEALGFTQAIATTQTSLPAQMRRVLREEFHYFFPAQEWIERGNVLNTLLVRLEKTLPYAPLLALTGERGLGKSRLLAEIVEDMGEQYEILQVAHGAQAIRQLPFGLVLQILGPWIRKRGAALSQRLQTQLDAQELHEAARVLPELKPLLSSDIAAQRSPVDRARSVMTALITIFEEAASKKRVLLVLDDMQYTDEATIRLLDTLRTGKLQGKIAMVLAVDTSNDGNPCQEFIERWTRKGEMLHMEVPLMKREDVAPYVAALFPPIEGLDRRIDLLLEKSHGNPMLLEELLRFMVVRRVIAEKNGMLAVADFRPDILPSTIEDAIRRRREHLPVDCQAIVSQAAVAGVRFELRTVLKLTGETTAVLTEALQQACESLFLQPDERGTYRFISEAARDVFYESLSRTDRTRLHRKLGTMEEERATRTGEVTQTAYHYELAGDVAKSLEFLARLSQDYLSPKTLEVVVSDALHVKMFKTASDLTPLQRDQAILALNMFLRAFKSLGIYGKNSPVTQTSFGTSITVLMRLLKEVGPISYAYTEDHFYVNNHMAPASATPPEFKSVLFKHHLSGFEFLPDIDERQYHEFLELLISNHDAIEAAGGWWNACQEHKITGVMVNETVFVGVAEKELFDASKMKTVEEVVIKRAEDINRQPADSIEAMIASMAAASGSNEAMLTQLKKLQRMLEDLRKNGVSLGESNARQESGGVILDLDPETSTLITELLKQARPDELKRLLHLAASIDVPLSTFLQQKPQLMTQGLESPDPGQRTLSAMGLMKMGKEARRWLLHYLRQSDHPTGRAAAVFVLQKTEADPSQLLAEELHKCSTAEEGTRLLSAMTLGDIHWTQALTSMLHTASPELRRGALQILAQSPLPAAIQLELIGTLLWSDNLAEVEDAVRVVGDMGQAQSVPVLGNLLDKLARERKTPDVLRIQEQICHALGRIGDQAALPLLRPIVIRKGFLGSQWESSVRAAAVWGLGGLAFPEARDVLQKAVSDADANVSGTAKYVLARRPGGTDAIRRVQTEALAEVFGTEGLAVLEGEVRDPKS